MSQRRDRLRISGELNGPSWWQVERLEERFFVNRPPEHGGKGRGYRLQSPVKNAGLPRTL